MPYERNADLPKSARDRGTQVPARYAANVFALHAPHRLLVDRLVSLEKGASES